MNRLKELRMEKGLRQQDVADHLSVGKSTYHYWEKGQTEINNDNLFALSNFYSVSIDYLLGHSDERLTIPASLKNAQVAFHSGGDEDILQYEVDRFAEYAEQYAEQKKKKAGTDSGDDLSEQRKKILDDITELDEDGLELVKTMIAKLVAQRKKQ